MTVICPNCERLLETKGLQPGASISCSCGNVVAVPKQAKSGTWRKVLTTLLMVSPCVILPAIAIPRFIGFSNHARQAECRSNLKSLHTGLKAIEAPAPGSELTFSQIGFAPERPNRYSYFMGAGPMEDRSGAQAQGSEKARAIGVDTFKFKNLRVYTLEDLPRELASQVGVTGTWPNRQFVVACVGDIDNDPDDPPDVWSIASHERTLQGERVEAGEPYLHINDVTTD